MCYDLKWFNYTKEILDIVDAPEIISINLIKRYDLFIKLDKIIRAFYTSEDD